MLKQLTKFHIYRSFSQQTQAKAQSKPTPLDPNYTLDRSQIAAAVEAVPVLSSASKEIWQRSHEIFTNHGIKTNSFLQIITGNPNLLSRHPNKIIDGFESWRSCQFGEKYFHLLITKYPNLLDVTESHKLLMQVTYIKGYVGSTKNVWKLFMNSPQMVSESEPSMERKFQYLQRKMRIEVPEIVKSEVFSKSLDHLKTRHVFLDRLGLFKPRSIRADPNEPSKNPKLYQIVDSSDKGFSTRIAGVTLPEWEVFQELYMRELNSQREPEELNDDDDEEDDDEE